MNVHVFGDSISYGLFDFQKLGWVRRLKIYLRKKGHIKVKNHSIIGLDSNSLLQIITEKVKKEKIDITIIAIGTNDSQILNGVSRISLESFCRNLKSAVNLLKEIGSELVFIGLIRKDLKRKISWWSPIKRPSYNNRVMSKYDTCIQNVSKECDVLYLPLADLFVDRSRKLFFDCIHPNSAGHKMIFERVKNGLEKKQLI